MASEAVSRLIVWGAGALGGRIAQRWVEEGAEVIAYTRSDRRHVRLRQAGVQARLGSPVAELTSGDRLLLALPGHERQLDAIRALANAPRVDRAVLISSTGVYAGVSGRVDENGPLGTTPRARRIVAVEQSFARRWPGGSGVVIRAGGLYEKGRGPYSALLRRGEAPLGPPDRTLALIHYDDLAAAAYRALVHPDPQERYLAVVAPTPSRRAFYLAACRKAGLPAPRFTVPVDRPRVDYDSSLMTRDLLPWARHRDWREALE